MYLALEYHKQKYQVMSVDELDQIRKMTRLIRSDIRKESKKEYEKK